MRAELLVEWLLMGSSLLGARPKINGQKSDADKRSAAPIDTLVPARLARTRNNPKVASIFGSLDCVHIHFSHEVSDMHKQHVRCVFKAPRLGSIIPAIPGGRQLIGKDPKSQGHGGNLAADGFMQRFL